MSYGELRPGQYGTTAGLWHLNGNSTDFSGNNNHGTDTAITYSQANGKFGQGGAFNGSSSLVSCADSASLSITGDLSLVGWFNFAALPGSGSNEGLISKATASGDQRGYDFALRNVGGEYRWQLFLSSSGAYNAGNATDAYGVLTPSTGVWYHVAATHVISTKTTTIYINGNPLATTYVNRNATAINDNTSVFRIGRDESSAFFNGKADEVSAHSTALTANQIRQIYALGVGKYE